MIIWKWSKEDEAVQHKSSNDKKDDEEEDESIGKYELIESWSQTLDFSKKKKGTQCDAIEVEVADTQVIHAHEVILIVAIFMDFNVSISKLSVQGLANQQGPERTEPGPLWLFYPRIVTNIIR